MTPRHPLAGGAIAAAAFGPIGYLLFFRYRCLTWGARDDEVAAKLPGDELLPDAGLVTTRASTVDAPPSAIWPWLAQMGSDRGGAYTMLVMEPGSLVMKRKMLIGIKQRAERTSARE
jgi:hypothetical protein